PHTSRSVAQLEPFFRGVDRALGAHTAADPLPLVIAGTERDLAYFDHVTDHAASIIGRLTGNHELTAPDELTRLATPVVEQYLT
ncbi:baeRF3 domain-containing protein, partial [Klebsiella pneumoniae]|uniref:baeRF3 domain-containing protein n=1 Tax=Klebsiella pneumoniae TaxID=573 RepID=UPI004045B6F1